MTLVWWLYTGRGSRLPGIWLTAMYAITAVVEAWAVALADRDIPNLWLYNRYALLEFTTQLLFARACMRSPKLRTACLVALAGYLIVYVLEWMRMPGDHELMGRSAMFGALLLVTVFTYLLFQLTDDLDRSLLQRGTFWLYLSIVVYYGGMIPLMGLLNVLMRRNMELADTLYVINDVLYYTSSALVGVACVLYRREARPA